MRALRSAVLAVAAIAGVTAPAAPALAAKPSPPAADEAACVPAAMPGAERALVEMVNARRAAAGLDRLAGDRSLRKAARRHSRLMARRGVLAHSATLTWADGRPAGENLAQAPSPDLAMTAMVLSPRHLRNLMDPTWRWIGIGAMTDCAGGQLYTVDLVGRRP